MFEISARGARRRTPVLFARGLGPVRDGDFVVDDERQRLDVLQGEVAHQKVFLFGGGVDDDDKVCWVAVASQQVGQQEAQAQAGRQHRQRVLIVELRLQQSLKVKRHGHLCRPRARADELKKSTTKIRSRKDVKQ